MMRVISLATMALLIAAPATDARLNQHKTSKRASSLTTRRRMALTEEEELDFVQNPVDVKVVGDNGEPADAFPLGVCEGDCDDDDECAEGLVCFQRRRETPVPGCTFSSNPNSTESILESTDVCVPQPQVRGFLDIAGNDGNPDGAFPLKICQADCDGNDDCGEGLVCLRRNEEDDPVSIYCDGSPFNDEDYCVQAPGTVPPFPSGEVVVVAQAEPLGGARNETVGDLVGGLFGNNVEDGNTTRPELFNETVQDFFHTDTFFSDMDTLAMADDDDGIEELEEDLEQDAGSEGEGGDGEGGDDEGDDKLSAVVSKFGG